MTPVALVRCLTLTFAFALTVASAGAAQTQSRAGTVRGIVRFTSGETGAAGARVVLVGTPFTTVADSAGRFVIAAVPAGRYEVEARRLGATVGRAAISVVAADTAVVELYLARAPQELVGVRVVGAPADALARLPGSASVVSAAQLAHQQPLSANDVLRTVPGVHVQEEEGAGLRANIGIRGLDPDRSRTVLVLEDGVPVALAPYGEPEMYYSPPIERMERVEIVKGSGSILFGPQTIGGVVNYVTADAPALPTGDLWVQGGSGGTGLARMRYGGTWQNVRATGTAFTRRARDLAGLDLGVWDATTKVGFRTGAHDVGIKLSVYDESSNATYVGLTDSLFRAGALRHPAQDDRLRIRRYALTATHERPLGRGVEVRTSAYAYQTSREWQRQDYSYGPTGGTIVFRNSTGNRNRAFEVAGVEPRLRAAGMVLGRAAELEAGMRAHVERARDQFIVGSTGTSRTGTIRDDEVRTGAALAAFAQQRVYLTDAWHVTPGIRLEYFAFDRNILRTRVRRTTAAGTMTNNPEDVDILSRDQVADVIPGLGTAWSPNERLTVFAGAHRGFAPPRAKDAFVYENPVLAPDAQVPAPVSLQLDAERSWNYEVGTRLAPLHFLSVEATAFYLDFSNQIIEPSLSAGSVAQAALANQGRTRHRGVEAALSIDVGRLVGAPYALGLTGAVTLVDAVFAGDRFMRTASGDTVNVRGNQLPYAPRAKTSAAVTFEHPRGLAARLDATWVGRQFSDNFETVTPSANGRVGAIRAYQVIDVAGRVPIPGVRGLALTGTVKNLAGATYIASRRPEGIKPGLPRLVSLGLGWGF